MRYYEAHGLLEADRGANGYREYNESAVLRVKQIRHLLGAGLSSEDLAYWAPSSPTPRSSTRRPVPGVPPQ